MKKYDFVSARPVKGFFVEMLTRDITVEDAILDLLDNCVDGIQRSLKNKPQTDPPYKGFWAKITVNKDNFQIEDNCGGIPWSEHDRAFRMGRPRLVEPQIEPEPMSVGVYGIGMKRAIFKMGRNALIWTQNGNDTYEIPISTEWMNNEELWDLSVNEGYPNRKGGGTIITVKDLNPEISEHFSAESFQDQLFDKIQSHYSIIIQKGLHIEINGTEVKPKTIEIRFAKKDDSDGTVVRPYIFKGKEDDVEVFLAIGLREPIPGIEQILAEQDSVQFSSDYAGWTVICNDRVVLYCNRDELTGWGIATIPRYHTQFIAISGIVEFRGNPKNLPTTTTKRGLDFSSAIYQRTLDHMREGMRLFIDFTNKWKTREDEAKLKVSPAPALSFSEIHDYSEKKEVIQFAKVRTGLTGEQYRPKLPLPPSDAFDVRISYIREKSKVIQLAEELLPNFEELNIKDMPRLVGEKSFDNTFKELVKEKKKPLDSIKTE